VLGTPCYVNLAFLVVARHLKNTMSGHVNVRLPILVTVLVVPVSGMQTLYIALSLILPTPHYDITPWLHIITSQYVVTPQLCHYSAISQSHVCILEF